MLPVYDGKCLSCEAVHNWSRNMGKLCWWLRRSTRGAEVAKTKVKRVLTFRFRHSGKAMGQVYQCWCRICQEINDFLGLNIICFMLYIYLWPIYLLSLVHKGLNIKQIFRNIPIEMNT
jgi:hypothetical protein